MNDAIFVALLFRGGREGAEAPQIFHPGAGVEICGDLARFPNCKDAFTILANSISRTPALLKYYTALGSDGQGSKRLFFRFLDFSGFLFAFSDLLTDLARACLGFLERPSRSCEFVRLGMVRTIAQGPC